MSTVLRSWIRISWKVALFVGLLFALSMSGDWLLHQITGNLTPSTEPTLHRFILAAIAIYTCLIILPFVPGAEIGFGLIAALGPNIAPLMYVCTVVALSTAFLIGRLIPQEWIIRSFEFFHLKRAAGLLRSMAGLDFDARIEFLIGNSASRLLPLAIRYRFIALMILLNIPGNSVLGGGGGISMVAGYSRLFPFPSFLAAVALAVAPVPLFLFLMG